MKSVLISIRPKWCEKIANGEKTIEVRKTRPKLETPFKCYIYCTKDPKMQFWAGPRYAYADDHRHNAFDKCGNGKVIGEFTCADIRAYAWARYATPFDDNGEYNIPDADFKACCLPYRQLDDYGDGDLLYGWHISDLVIYNKPKELSEFRHCGDNYHFNPIVTRPPQSWCYVEGGADNG